MTENKRPLIVIAGPTASGKTGASIELAKRIGGEIISADSMQVYKYLDIGSAKITEEEKEGIPHHLIDILDPREEFNVTVFKRLAEEAMAGIYERGHVPILVGGTGFYIQALVKDVDFTENGEDKTYRHSLERLASEEGAEVLFEMLRRVDPDSCEIIPQNNVKRVIRALEFYHETNIPISRHNAQERLKSSPYDLSYFVLNPERALLYERIEKRVDRMMEKGLLHEVEFLRDYGCTREMTSMQGLGYRQLYMYLDGELSLEEAVNLTKQETRHFAKRQVTWFKREKDVRFIDPDREDLIDVFFNGHQ